MADPTVEALAQRAMGHARAAAADANTNGEGTDMRGKLAGGGCGCSIVDGFDRAWRYYWSGPLDRAGAERLLAGRPRGTFLLRRKAAHVLAISFVGVKKVGGAGGRDGRAKGGPNEDPRSEVARGTETFEVGIRRNRRSLSREHLRELPV